jgi:NADH dehydrogenase
MIVVVGGRGLVGGAVVETLRHAGHRVVVVTHARDRAAEGLRFGDVRYPETLRPALEDAEVVVQAVAFPGHPVENPRRRHTHLEFDARGSERLIAAARAVGVRRYVYLSAAGVRGDSRAPWDQAIWRGEQAVLDSQLEAVCVRPTWIYGPGDRTVNRILAWARRLPVVPVLGDGSQRLQPVWVGDVAEVVRQAVAPRAAQGVFEVGGPDVMTADDVIRTLLRVVGLGRRIVHVPIGFARLAARALAWLPGAPVTPDAVAHLTRDRVASLGPLLSAFELVMTPFPRGLAAYLGPRGTARPPHPPGCRADPLSLDRPVERRIADPEPALGRG